MTGHSEASAHAECDRTQYHPGFYAVMLILIRVWGLLCLSSQVKYVSGGSQQGPTLALN